MTDNELVDLCVTCGCTLACYNNYFDPGVDADKALSGLRESKAARVLLPAKFHWRGTFFTPSLNRCVMLLRDTGNSSWRISCSYPRIIIKKFVDDEGGLLDSGLMTMSLESPADQLKFDEQANRMSLESLKDLVFSIVKDCNDKTKELRRTEILASSKEWN